MKFVRYSAIEMFGAPVDDIEHMKEPDYLYGLIRSYDLAEHSIDREPQDITPYFWQRPAFRYFLSLAHPEGPAVLDMLPVTDGSEATLFIPSPIEGTSLAVQGIRRQQVEEPGQLAVIAGGGSPRFPDNICVFELITCLE